MSSFAPLDDVILDRVLDGSVDDVPHEYTAVAAVLDRVRTGLGAADDVAIPRHSHEETEVPSVPHQATTMVAAMVAAHGRAQAATVRRGVRRRAAFALSSLGTAATISLAASGALPAAAQQIAHDVFQAIGIQVPASGHGVHNPGGAGSGSIRPLHHGGGSMAPVPVPTPGAPSSTSDLGLAPDNVGGRAGGAAGSGATGGGTAGVRPDQGAGATGEPVVPGSGGRANPGPGQISSPGSTVSSASSGAGDPATTPASGGGQPGKSGAAPGQSGPTSGQSSSSPGHSGSAPGQAGTSPGQSGSAPGQSGTSPGQSGSAPGQSGTSPGQSATSPGQSATSPGQSGTSPGQSGTSPGQSGTTTGGTAPGQSGLGQAHSTSASGGSATGATGGGTSSPGSHR